MDSQWTSGKGGEPTATPQADLLARLSELRARLDVLAPGDEEAAERARAAADGIRRANERIATLERLLAESRAREETLAAAAVRDHRDIVEMQAHLTELSGTASRVASAEAGIAEAHARAEEADRRAAANEEQMATLESVKQELTTRVATLEEELHAARSLALGVPSDQARASRLETERDAAREEAAAERRAALDARLRLASAEGRVRALTTRLATLDDKVRDLTMQQAGAAPAEAEAASERPLVQEPEAEAEATEGPMIDLRDPENPVVSERPSTRRSWRG
jgi:chromosome segregation ATPase